MNHELAPVEQAILDDLLERYRFTPVIVRLSATMLDKSIIDARTPHQAMLARSGLIEYAAIEQGPDAKVSIELPFAGRSGESTRRVSFYRPVTKKGDPRLWVERLAGDARAGDALVMAVQGPTVAFFVLSGNRAMLEGFLGRYFPGRFEERGELEVLVARLKGELVRLIDQWVPTGRRGPTGVGYTLESLWGIKANSSRSPDFEGLELKAYRRAESAGADKLVTLLSKTPDWMGVEKGLGLLTQFGYWDDKRGRTALYCTITTKRNSLGWELQVDPDQGKVFACKDGVPVVSYDFDVLQERLEEKHPATLFVVADCRNDGGREEFCYNEAWLCRDPSLPNLLELIEEGLLGLDFTLHIKKSGASRDHGYLWRIRESAIPRLYAYRRQLSGEPRAD